MTTPPITFEETAAIVQRANAEFSAHVRKLEREYGRPLTADEINRLQFCFCGERYGNCTHGE